VTAIPPDAKTNATASSSDIAPKPRLAYLIATGFGLGYLPWTPGSWGSLLGIFLAWVALVYSRGHGSPDISGAALATLSARTFAQTEALFIVIFSIAGVWAAEKVTRHLRKEDPQLVVVDEIAGQLITYLALATPRTFSPGASNWKYFLLGFILFRVLDVWKPFPARQAESLPGGLGIMADDWMAGAYAAVGLGLIRYFLH
jgi:phosphatidylglycerophosphatase A